MSAFTVVIPARNEARLLSATLEGILRRPAVATVVVVDDASEDGTGDVAAALGVPVLRRRKSQGKSAALMAGAAFARAEGLSAESGLLLLDADVGQSVGGIDPVFGPLIDGSADLAIAKYVARGAGGGRGRVVTLARNAVREVNGWEPDVPLSGIRCMSWSTWDAVTPLAKGWAVETAMTLDALEAGLRVVEVETTMTHRAAGSDWRARRHRGRQYLDVRLALTVRGLRKRLTG